MKTEVIVNMKDGEILHVVGDHDQGYQEIFNGIERARENNASVIVYDKEIEVERPARDVHSIEFLIKD